MEILVLSHRLPYPPNKGEKLRTFYQIAELAKQGHQITVYSPRDTEDDDKNCKQFNQLENISSELFPLAFKPLRLALGFLKGESLSAANFHSDALQNKFDQVLLSSQFDVILCSSSAMAKYISHSSVFASLATKPKLLMDFMDLDSDKWRQYAESSGFPMGWLYSREAKKVGDLEAFSQANFDACYFISEAEVELFGSATKTTDNVHVLGNGLNTEEFYPANPAPELKPDAPVFIFTGVMDYKPNVDAVLWFVESCWHAVIEKYPNAEFIVAGMNPSPKIEALKSQPGITVTGFVDEILPYYHKANYFVAPFRLARGVQNKVLQAFACGLPVITTPMGAEGINCSDGEHLLLASEPEQFLAAIEQLNQSQELRESLSQNALELIIREFSWEGKLKPLSQLLVAE